MKKLFLTGILLISILFCACGKKDVKISEEKAKDIALKDAEIARDDATFRKSQIEKDNGKDVYEIEFYSKDNVEYDYEIDANTGEVISSDKDMENDKPSMSDNQQNQDASAVNQGETSTITEQEAKEIALKKVSGATEKDIKEFKKDRDDGKTYYDGKIVYDKKEYEFEIDAQTGTITEWDIDSVNE